MSKEIKILRLSSGEELIAETTTNETDGYVTVYNPLILLPDINHQNKMTLGSWMPYMNQDGIVLNKNYVAAYGCPDDGFLKEYTRYLSQKNQEMVIPDDRKLILQ